jgi:hypothetical protein
VQRCGSAAHTIGGDGGANGGGGGGVAGGRGHVSVMHWSQAFSVIHGRQHAPQVPHGVALHGETVDVVELSARSGAVELSARSRAEALIKAEDLFIAAVRLVFKINSGVSWSGGMPREAWTSLSRVPRASSERSDRFAWGFRQECDNCLIEYPPSMPATVRTPRTPH